MTVLALPVLRGLEIIDDWQIVKVLKMSGYSPVPLSFSPCLSLFLALPSLHHSKF